MWAAVASALLILEGMRRQQKVVIIGAGPGGLCAAMLLSSRGFDVTVLERREEVGGRSGALHVGPYRFDLGSTMVMMPFVVDEMFALAGRETARELELVKLDPMYRLDFGDRALDVSSDPWRMASELERFSPGSALGHAEFLRREAERLAHLYPVLQRDWPNLASMASPLVAAAMPHVGLGRSLWDTAGEYFSDPALQLAFSFQSAYLGMSPWECPGGFAMVPYVEHAWGVFHIQGGIARLCETMARIAEEDGARIRTGVGVAKLVVEGERCTGVLLEGGERLACDEVVVNADGAEALNTLLDEPVSARFNRHRLEHLAESCSTFMLYLGLDRPLPLTHHTFFFARDYLAEMDRVFRQGTLGADLSLYVCNPSRTDPSLAPPGHSALYLLALVPNTRAKLDWHQEGPHLRERVLDLLEHRGEVAVRPNIVVERCITPRDWEYQFGVSHGAVFGPAHRIDQLLALRLPNQLPWPQNVMLAGGATSPGSGLPTILESARISSRLICERNDQPFPPSRPLPQPTFALAG